MEKGRRTLLSSSQIELLVGPTSLYSFVRLGSFVPASQATRLPMGFEKTVQPVMHALPPIPDAKNRMFVTAEMRLLSLNIS